MGMLRSPERRRVFKKYHEIKLRNRAWVHSHSVPTIEEIDQAGYPQEYSLECHEFLMKMTEIVATMRRGKQVQDSMIELCPHVRYDVRLPYRRRYTSIIGRSLQMP
jgi:hypothetical protein